METRLYLRYYRSLSQNVTKPSISVYDDILGPDIEQILR